MKDQTRRLCNTQSCAPTGIAQVWRSTRSRLVLNTQLRGSTEICVLDSLFECVFECALGLNDTPHILFVFGCGQSPLLLVSTSSIEVSDIGSDDVVLVA